MDLGIANVASITVICYLVGMGVKVSPLNDKYIPVLCGEVGALLGILAFIISVPDFPAQDPLTAVAVGVVSGLASTGINQIGKQMGGEE